MLDSPLVKGLPRGFSPPSPNQLWYGVFLWAKNQHHHAYRTSDNFEIVDSEGTTYRPIRVNTALTPWAWTAQLLQYNDTDPGPDSVQASSPARAGCCCSSSTSRSTPTGH